MPTRHLCSASLNTVPPGRQSRLLASRAKWHAEPWSSSSRRILPGLRRRTAAAAPRRGRGTAGSGSGSGSRTAGSAGLGRSPGAGCARAAARPRGRASGSPTAAPACTGARGAEHLVDVADLDDLAEVHDGHPVGDVPDHRQVVGHEQVGQPEPGLQLLQQVDHTCLDGDVERGDRLVEHEQLGLQGQRAGDADALALTAGELRRVAVGVLGAQARPDRAARGPAAAASLPRPSRAAARR